MSDNDKNEPKIDIDAVFGNTVKSFTEARKNCKKIFDDNTTGTSNMGYCNPNMSQSPYNNGVDNSMNYQIPKYGYDDPSAYYTNDGYYASPDAYNGYGYNGFSRIPQFQQYGYPSYNQSPYGEDPFNTNTTGDGYSSQTYGKVYNGNNFNWGKGGGRR